MVLLPYYTGMRRERQEVTDLPWRHRLWLEVGPRSWWVWSFALLCLAGYQLASGHQEVLTNDLAARCDRLERQINEAKVRQDRLLTVIGSQSDPVWIEQVMIRALGVVPEGQTKVYFVKEVH